MSKPENNKSKPVDNFSAPKEKDGSHRVVVFDYGEHSDDTMLEGLRTLPKANQKKSEKE